MIPYIFGISFLTAIVSVILLARNMLALISVDTAIDAGDTLLGDKPLRNTHDNFMGAFRKHITIAIVFMIGMMVSVVTGTAWIVQVLSQ